MEKKTANYWINKYNLEKHPEGGYYRRTFQSNIEISDDNLPYSFQGKRHLATSIYYLLNSHEVSLFHRLKSDEVWYYHFGSPTIIHMFSVNGVYSKTIIGPTIQNDFEMQVILPAGSIFGAEIVEPDSYGLFGCMVVPGFDFADFEIVEREFLLKKFPENRKIIEKFTFD